MSRILPYGKRIVVKREEVKEVSEGGLYLPPVATDKEKPRKGLVLSTCDGSGIAEGDVVVFGKFAGLEIDDVLILKLEDVQGICK